MVAQRGPGTALEQVAIGRVGRSGAGRTCGQGFSRQLYQLSALYGGSVSVNPATQRTASGRGHLVAGTQVLGRYVTQRSLHGMTQRERRGTRCIVQREC
jgi:hypothetical protein